MVGVTRKPPTDIQRPLEKAVNASATTKIGNIADIKTTRASAATRLRNRIAK